MMFSMGWGRKGNEINELWIRSTPQETKLIFRIGNGDVQYLYNCFPLRKERSLLIEYARPNGIYLRTNGYNISMERYDGKNHR